MNICFVLPKFARQPIGGYKMIFEYSNRLVDGGHKAVLMFLNDDALKQFYFPNFFKKIAANYLTIKEPRWFDLNPEIVKISNLDKNIKKYLKNIDICFATGIETVAPLKEFFPQSRHCYFIQGYETWRDSEAYIHKTYALGMTNIVVASWLKDLVDQYAVKPSILIKNPIDLSVYRMTKLLRNRKQHTVALLYHESENKGLKYSLAALDILKVKYSDLEVQMFGTPVKPKGIPEWISYTRGASQKKTVEIYNSVEVFLCASIEEGFGLTGLEAMACGAALVSTSYKGVFEYAIDNKNALLSPIRDVSALVRNVSELFENKEKRVELVDNGLRTVQKFSWDSALNRLEAVIMDRE